MLSHDLKSWNVTRAVMVGKTGISVVGRNNTLVSVCKQSLWDWVRAISLDYHPIMEKARMWTTIRTEFSLVFSSNLQKIDSPESFLALFFTGKLARLLLLKEVKPSSPDRIMIKPLRCNNSFPPLHSRYHP